ncbi:hypothetical protein [Roseobacter sinensis]|uniref:Uncharacterized protein n=1 Tax=Roseobacter sinensis TaxID=2931391 RepID=A0ABT3BC08_9RHOB|nr:hypothetical protein [Roseobacter sp. WL0113]MCV3270704.1 hypothetical protein [Roseobacter sp. WL0113]
MSQPDGDHPREVYPPRAVTRHGVAEVGALRVKVYGLAAPGKEVTAGMRARAERFLAEEVCARVAEMGDSNDLGFVIIHPGDWGISIAAQWWVQGSVLCQHIYRQLYEAAEPMDTAHRPVVGCVWELAIIEAEQATWRETMMGATPKPERYLATWLRADHV